MTLDPLRDQLNYFNKLEKVVISKRSLFKEIAIMHGIDEFYEIKGNICNIFIENLNKFNFLLSLAVFSRLIVVKLKQDLKFRDHGFFELVCPHILHRHLVI